MWSSRRRSRAIWLRIAEALVCCEGDFVVAVETVAVIDLPVGTFDHPASRLGPDTISMLTPAVAAGSATVVPV
jgi:hypothetical protein